jgi:hypothetical protein
MVQLWEERDELTRQTRLELLEIGATGDAWHLKGWPKPQRCSQSSQPSQNSLAAKG